MTAATVHSVCIDIAPITRRHVEPVEVQVEVQVGDQVRVHFEDSLGIEAPHTLDGFVVELFQHNRLGVRIGNTKFSVPAEACELIGRAR